MCFGSEEQKTTTTTPSPMLSAAANQSLAQIQALNARGYQSYPGGGQAAIAPFGDLQSHSFDLASWLNGSGGAPYAPEAQGMIEGAAGAAPGSVNASTIASHMSPYMNAYVEQALAPQIEGQNQQFNAQNRGFDAQATGAGAFGDTGWGIGRTNLTNQQNLARSGLLGTAYTNAFNTAIGAGAQDVSTDMTAQMQSAQLREQALARMFGGATSLEGLGGYQMGGINFLNTLGQQQTAQDQAKRSFDYSQFNNANNIFPLQTAQLGTQAVSSLANAFPSTQTVSAPDNSGFQAAGTIAAAGVKALPAMMPYMMMMSDERLKEDIREVGKTPDGLPLKVFNFKGDSVRRLGLIAQDVEKIYPEAVIETPSGYKAVNYDLALGGAFGLH